LSIDHTSAKIVVKSIFINLMDDLTNMKVDQSVMLSPQLAQEMANLGHLLARLRQARKVKQADAALRAGFSRNTAYRLEKGDPGLAIGQVLRYLDAIAPGATLADLLTRADPALTALQARESTKRVRDLTAAELAELNF
jgi:transcriptional regulator with XRE-family HTH domain